jgi:hypothetical protein
MDLEAVTHMVVWAYTELISYRTQTNGEIFYRENEPSGSIKCGKSRV